MERVAVVTDSNSGIQREEAERRGVYILPMPFLMDGTQYFEGISLSQEEFYEKLMAGADISTSQPSVTSVTDLWNGLLKDHDTIVHIPMSSGLSASYETAAMLAQDYGERVHVVNNQRISVTQRQSVLDAADLAAAGRSAREIREILEREKYESSIYIMVDTLKYLKKGGRITPAGAAIAAVLNIKPVLQIQGEKLDAFAKVRGAKQGRALLIDAMRRDFSSRFVSVATPERMWLQVVYSFNREAAADFQAQVEAAFPGFDTYLDALSLSVACHIGPGSLAIACSKKIDP